MHTFQFVEQVLTELHGGGDFAKSRISSRIKHFNRLGFFPTSPGKGKRISYTFEDVAKWEYALQILEFGLDPTAMLFVVDKTWSHVFPRIEEEDSGRNDLIVITPRAVSYPGNWASFDFSVMDSASFGKSWNIIRRMMIINLSGLAFDLRLALSQPRRHNPRTDPTPATAR